MSSISTPPRRLPLAEPEGPPTTPDGRYIIVRGRLWRASNPDLPEDRRQELVGDLMDARRGVAAAKRAGDAAAEKAARASVHLTKVALGERGPVWWNDGAPDQNRKLVHNSTYAGWWEAREGASPD
ncbi:hypothetical protein [Erythrobacter ani]|uniref:hypothetical protein n=1 Tax=Erythrobacter ani TaxID=2827235 RepID=UPI003F71E8B1